MTEWTGELREYMMRSRQRQAGDNSFTRQRKCLSGLKCPKSGSEAFSAIRLRWVERHRDQWTAGGVRWEGEHVPSNETQAVRLR